MSYFYVTTPIYYVNDAPHIGHAYTSLAADFIARFMRLDKYKVKFLTGTDEHGQKIEKAAMKNGVEPQEFTDEVAAKFIHLNQVMQLSNDDFIRTTEIRHKKFVQDMWMKLFARDSIYLGKYKGWYAVRDEAYYRKKELIDGKAPTGAEVQWVEEDGYFFRLSKWQGKLLKFYRENPDFIKPQSRYNEVIAFVKAGLKDLCVSRTSFSWGIKVPECNNHVIYVWLDALFNYISALGDTESPYWPCDVHIVGKDILRFHAIYWPAFLMALNIKLPKCIYAHGWWTKNGEKISKSLGNVIDPLELIKKYGLDYVRYFFLREITFGNDGNFVEKNFVIRINTELANNVGNLIQRVLSFIYKECQQKIPQFSQMQQDDQKLLQVAYDSYHLMKKHMNVYALNNALEVIQSLASKANEYIDHNAPWSLLKTDIVRMQTVLYILAEVIRVIAILLQPIIPNSAVKILDMLSISDRDMSTICASYSLKVGSNITKPEAVFPRINI